MIVAAHQPHFLPWLGYFDKILHSDVFVIVDHVQFERQNFQNRNRIKTRNGVQWLVVPVLRGSRGDRIVDKQIDNKRDGRTTWGERIFRTLAHAYTKAPWFRAHRDFFEHALTRPWTRLCDLDLAIIHYLLEQLEIHTPLVRSSALDGIQGARSDMIVTLCGAVGADTYLSGSGGSREYLDVASFTRRHIQVSWQSFEHPEYPQLAPPSGFAPRLSAVDLLFNCGPEAAAILRGGHHISIGGKAKHRVSQLTL
ncbi:MAG TPA: WbqC family protein [Kofleriaceae bacterium]|nr:WbqC family protein [Kofleriaceae bacterium]